MPGGRTVLPHPSLGHEGSLSSQEAGVALTAFAIPRPSAQPHPHRAQQQLCQCQPGGHPPLVTPVIVPISMPPGTVLNDRKQAHSSA